MAYNVKKVDSSLRVSSLRSPLSLSFTSANFKQASIAEAVSSLN